MGDDGAGIGPMSHCTPSRATLRRGRSRSHRLRRHRRAVEGSTREGAGDEPYIALGDPEGVADVAGAITVHVTQRGIRYRGAETGTYVELRDQQGVANVHYPIPLHVPTGEGPRGDLVDGSIAPAAPVDDVGLAPRAEADRALRRPRGRRERWSRLRDRPGALLLWGRAGGWGSEHWRRPVDRPVRRRCPFLLRDTVSH